MPSGDQCEADAGAEHRHSNASKCAAVQDNAPVREDNAEQQLVEGAPMQAGNRTQELREEMEEQLGGSQPRTSAENQWGNSEKELERERQKEEERWMQASGQRQQRTGVPSTAEAEWTCSSRARGSKEGQE